MPDDGGELRRDNGGGSRPVPDPTLLTTEALMREVLALRELLEQRISALRDVVEERITGQIAVRQREFENVERALETAEQQRIEQKADTKAAVDAALTAQKEAVAAQTDASERSIAKSEAATTKAIEQMGSTFSSGLDGLRREISDLKERVTTVEQRKVGSVEATTESRGQRTAGNQAIGLYIAGAAALLTFGGIVVVLISAHA